MSVDGPVEGGRRSWTLALRERAVATLPPERRLVVILISFAVFFAIVTWSARRLLRLVRR